MHYLFLIIASLQEVAAYVGAMDNVDLQQHRVNLEKCCRVCGIKFNRVHKAKTGYICKAVDRKSGVPFAELLQHMFNIFIEYDHPDIHPSKFCHKCYLVISRWCVAQDRQRHYNPSTKIYLWNAHDDTCSFCARFALVGTSSKGKYTPGKPKWGNPGSNATQLNMLPLSTQADHAYAEVPIHTRFVRARKRKHEGDVPSEKKRVLSVELEELDNSLELCSLYSRELCLAAPLHALFQCNICSGIIDTPYKTSCNHVFCSSCIKRWVQRFNCCGQCDELLSLRNLSPCDQPFCELVLDLPMKCLTPSCNEQLTVRTFKEHIKSFNCVMPDETQAREDQSDTIMSANSQTETSSLNTSFLGSYTDSSSLDDSILSTSSTSRRGRPPKSLISLNHTAQNARLKTLKEAIKEHAVNYNEDLRTVYYALLLNHLRSNKNWKEHAEVNLRFTGESHLSSTKCLAIKVSTFMSVTKYRRVQQVTNSMAERKIFQPYSALIKAEKSFLPDSVKYHLSPPMVRPDKKSTSIGAYLFLHASKLSGIKTPFC